MVKIPPFTGQGQATPPALSQIQVISVQSWHSYEIPRWCRTKEFTCQGRRCKKHRFNPSWEDPLDEEMATHSSILVWKIPWTEEPGRLQSMESQTIRHDLARMHGHDLPMDARFFSLSNWISQQTSRVGAMIFVNETNEAPTWQITFPKSHS